MTLEYHIYDSTDLREVENYDPALAEGWRFMFYADVAGDNSDLFADPIDNKGLTDKLKSVGAVDKEVLLSPEACCFYAYFTSKKSGVEFLKKLSAYLVQKKSLLEKAKDF